MLTATDAASSNEQQRRPLAIPPVAVVVVCLVFGRVMPEHRGHALSGLAGDPAARRRRRQPGQERRPGG